MKEKWKFFHRAQLNTSRGPWESKRTRKIPAEPGRTKERRRKRKRRGSGKGPATWGDMKVRSSLHIQGSPSSGTQFGQESIILCGKRTRQPVCGSRTVRPTHGVLTPALPTQPERHAHRCRQGLGAEMWGSESRPRQRIEVSCEETS